MEFIKIGNIVLPTHFIKAVSGTPASFTVSVGFAILTNFTFEGLEGKEAFDALYNFQPHPPLNLDPVIVIKSGMPMTVRSIEMLDGTVIPVSVTAGDEVIPVKDIVWIDLKAHFDDTNELGIEVGLYNEDLIQVTGDVASDLYDQIENLLTQTTYTGDR